MTWERNKLALCAQCRRTLKSPGAPADVRDQARAVLRMTQEHMLRLRLARRLNRFLRHEITPFTAHDHARLFDGLHLARDSMDQWRARVALEHSKHMMRKFGRGL